MTKAYYVQVAEQIIPIYGVSTLDEAQYYVNSCDHTKIVETEDDVYMNVATGSVDFSSNWDDLDEVTPVVYNADLETWIASPA